MLTTYREAWVDFVQVPTLCRRAGCSASDLALVAAKELIDNALDASPKGVEVAHADRTLTVTDKGPGLSEDQILSIFDVRRPSFSSKRWRLARRGALGNGVRVVMGVVHVSGGSLTVESRGAGFKLTVASDGSTRVVERYASSVTAGSRIGLTFGPALDADHEKITEHALLCQCATGSAYGGTKAVPTWFDAPAILALVRDMPPETSVMEFAKAFDLSDAALAAIKATGARKTTAEILADDDALGVMTHAILSGQKSSRKLNRMGKNALGNGEAYAFVETTFKLGGATLPAFVECWIIGDPVATRKTDGRVMVDNFFANRTPALMRKGFGLVSAQAKEISFGFGNTNFTLANPAKGPCTYVIDLAVTAPELPLVSDGKAIDVHAFSDAILDAIAMAIPRAYVAPTGKVEREAKQRLLSIKEAVYQVIVETYNSVAAAGIGAPPRMLMYRCRPEILRLTGRSELNYATFNGALQDFMDDWPELTKDWAILYDDRGHFIEPGGRAFGIGTLAVDEFIDGMDEAPSRFLPAIGKPRIAVEAGQLIESANPAHRFGAVVFVEKEGYTELIRKARIAERFDVAFASTKGVPNTSIRRLLDTLAEYGVKVFVLHDLDITGLTIAHTLRTSNKRYQFRNDLDFIDMGVRLADAEALGLEPEPFKLDAKRDLEKLRELLVRYGATAAEIALFLDRKQRVEIDAMTPRQLIDFIEGKLAENGVGKIVPDEVELAAQYRQVAFEQRVDAAIAPLRAEFEERFRAVAQELRESGDLETLVPPLQDAVRQQLAADPGKTWREAVARLAERDDPGIGGKAA